MEPGMMQEPLQAGFWSYLLVFLVTTVVSYLLRPKPDSGEPADFQGPITEEGTPLKVVFGTSKVGPNVTWFGDVHVEEITKRAPGLPGFFGEEVPLGFGYSAGIMFAICWGPVDELVDIYVADYRISDYDPNADLHHWFHTSIDPISPELPIQGETNPTRVNIWTPRLFGGPEQSGGIVGDLDFHWGSVEQGPNDYLSLFWDEESPRTSHYRRVCYAVLRRMLLGKNPAPAPWWFVVKRIPKNLDDAGKAEINGDCNPAEIIWEIVTNRIWGLGRPEAELDKSSFQAVRDTLFTEGLGLSFTYSNQSEAWEKIRSVLQHIDGVLFQHPTTGKLTLRLIRGDYSVGSLIELNKSNSVLESYTRGSWRETVNETRLRYTSRERRFSPATAQAQNLAAIQAMGETVTQTVELPGITDPDVAQRAVEQLNRESSIPLARLRIRAQRLASTVELGQPMVARYPEKGIDELVVRVVSIDYGTLEEGRVVIEAVQDVFDLSGVAYGVPGDIPFGIPCGPLALLLPGYDPALDPNGEYGLGEQRLFEAPYWHVGAVRRAWALVGVRSNTDQGWVPYVSENGAPFERDTLTEVFCPVGMIEDEYSAETDALDETGFTVRSLGKLEDLTSTDGDGLTAGARLALIGEEIISWRDVTNNEDGTYTIQGVLRGQLNTVPVTHEFGTRVYFYHPSASVDISSTDYEDATHVALKPLRVDEDGEDDPDSIEAAQILLDNHATAPYPPGNVELDGNGYDAWPDNVVGDATLSWTHRSRTEQTEMVAQDDATAYTLDGDLTIEALLDGTVVRTWEDETGTSITYTLAQRQSDDADLSKEVEFRITPTGAGGVIGTARTTPPFTMTES